MAGLSDLTGRHGVIEQLFVWQIAGQVISALLAPAFTALQQDALKAHPDMVIAPDVLASLAVRHLIGTAEAEAESAKSGINADNFAMLAALARIRISPADLAEAVLRDYVTLEAAEAEALPQGIDSQQLAILRDLAGDAIGPQQAAEALRRKLMPREGRGAAAVSYVQAIAESRLHDKWGPVLFELTQALLSPADAAEAVVRGFLPHEHAEAIAALSGVTADNFATMVRLAGDAPGPQQLAEALRRGAIPRDSGSPDKPGFLQGIREGRLADIWAPVIETLAQVWPTPVAALDALLKGQLTHEQALKLYERLGGAPEFFTVLFDTQGESPTPLELIDMANRQFIPWTGTGPNAVSYEQGFKEGRWKNKWSPVYKRFAEYTPPEGTILSLVEHGSIGNDEAAQLLAKRGVPPELIRDFLDDAHTLALTDYRGATVSIVLDSYYAQTISHADARSILIAMHLTPQAADLYLAYTDVKRAFLQVNAVITRVRTLFAARKITVQTAVNALTRLELPQATIEEVIATWEIENSVNVKVLTETQIVDAASLGILTEQEAITELGNIGYTPFDSWVLLSIKAKAALPNRPAQGPAGPQGQVIPGTT